MIIREDIVVYKGRNSPRTITVSLHGSPIDFESVATKMGIVINGVEYSSEDGFIEYEDGGLVTFKLGTVPTPPTTKSLGRLILYTDEYLLGRPIITEKTDYQLLFEFR
jgi:hypothetical protein